MSWFFAPHARARALERYSLALTIKELSAIATACNTGSAALLRNYPDGTKAFCVEVRGIKTFPVIREGVIITFQPADFIVARVGREHRTAALRKRKLSRKIGKPDTPQPYQRQARVALGDYE